MPECWPLRAGPDEQVACSNPRHLDVKLAGVDRHMESRPNAGTSAPHSSKRRPRVQSASKLSSCDRSQFSEVWSNSSLQMANLAMLPRQPGTTSLKHVDLSPNVANISMGFLQLRAMHESSERQPPQPGRAWRRGNHRARLAHRGGLAHTRHNHFWFLPEPAAQSRLADRRTSG